MHHFLGDIAAKWYKEHCTGKGKNGLNYIPTNYEGQLCKKLEKRMASTNR